MSKIIPAAALALLLATPAFAGSSATFVNRGGDEIGTATLTDTGKGVLIETSVKGLPPAQWIALHIHEGTECDAKGEFKSAGGHFNPTGAQHGYLDAKGPHAGDLPNLYTGTDGSLHGESFAPLVSLEGENAIEGKALVIHAGKDDYTSQPAGNAGNRIACAVIK